MDKVLIDSEKEITDSKTEGTTEGTTEGKTDAKLSHKINFDKVSTKELKKPTIKTAEIDNFLSEYKKSAEIIQPEQESINNGSVFTDSKTRKTRAKKPEKMFISGDIITGALFITMIDLALPMIIATINNTLDKHRKINANDLKLKASQRKELEPIADELVKQIEMKANPMIIMLISLVSIYGLNFVNVKYGLNE